MGQIMAATLPAGGNRTGQDRTGRDRSLNDFQEIFPLGPLGYGDIAGVWQVPLKGSAPVRRVRYRKKQACLAACIGAQKVTISSISANFHLQHLASSPSPAALFSLPQPSPHAPSFRFLCLSHSLLPSLPSPSSSPLRSFLLRIRYHTTPPRSFRPVALHSLALAASEYRTAPPSHGHRHHTPHCRFYTLSRLLPPALPACMDRASSPTASTRA
jgi:hypothetical protein